MGSEDEQPRQYYRYSNGRSRRSSRSGERDSQPELRPGRRSPMRPDIPSPQPRSSANPPRQTSRAHPPDHRLPPSILSQNYVPPAPHPVYSSARMTREELAQEDAQMRREDRLNKERHDVAKAHKRAEEARSRSRRRSDRAFSNPQHSSGEGGYSGDGRGYYTQEGRDPAPPPFSGSGYYPKVSAHPTEASIPSLSNALQRSRGEPEAPGSGHNPYNRPPSSDRRGERSTRQSRDKWTDEHPRQQSRTGERSRQRSTTGERSHERSRTRSPSLASMFRRFKDYTKHA